MLSYLNPEAGVRRCPVKKVFLKISQNSQENTYARVSFLIRLQARPFLQSTSGGCFCKLKDRHTAGVLGKRLIENNWFKLVESLKSRCKKVLHSPVTIQNNYTSKDT